LEMYRVNCPIFVSRIYVSLVKFRIKIPSWVSENCLKLK